MTNAGSPAVVAYVVARLMGRFASHPEMREWRSAIGLPGSTTGDDGDDDGDNDDQASAWARPLGVQTMVVSCPAGDDNDHDHDDHNKSPRLLLVEPSGRVLMPEARSASGRVVVAAMGRADDRIQTRLTSLFRRPDDLTTKTMSSPSWNDDDDDEKFPPDMDECKDVLIRILLEEASTAGDGGGSTGGGDYSGRGNVFVVESFSSTTGRLDRTLYRYDRSRRYVPIREDGSDGDSER
jgi:hypothetical protein